MSSPAPYLLRGYLGFRGHSLPQPGHGSGDGHGHADAHAVRALALVHHGDVERPVESMAALPGWAQHLWALPEQPQPSLGTSRLPSSYRALLTARVHLTAAALGCSPTRVFDYRLPSYCTAWCYLLPQAERLKKAHKVKTKTV